MHYLRGDLLARRDLKRRWRHRLVARPDEARRRRRCRRRRRRAR